MVPSACCLGFRWGTEAQDVVLQGQGGKPDLILSYHHYRPGLGICNSCVVGNASSG